MGKSVKKQKLKKTHIRDLNKEGNKHIIVFIWSQLDGGKVEQRTMAKFPPKPCI